MKHNIMFASTGMHGGPPMFGSSMLDLAEHEFRQVFDRIEDRILHHCDRPEIEMRILSFLSHAHGPTTEGIATAMSIPRSAAEVHLDALQTSGRIWCQRVRGISRAWYLSNEGSNFLAAHANAY